MDIRRYFFWAFFLAVLWSSPGFSGSIEGVFPISDQIPKDEIEILLINLNLSQVESRLDILSQEGSFIFWEVPEGQYGVVARRYLSTRNRLDFVEDIHDNLVISESNAHIDLGRLNLDYPSGISSLSLIADKDQGFLDPNSGIDIQWIDVKEERNRGTHQYPSSGISHDFNDDKKQNIGEKRLDFGF